MAEILVQYGFSLDQRLAQNETLINDLRRMLEELAGRFNGAEERLTQQLQIDIREHSDTGRDFTLQEITNRILDLRTSEINPVEQRVTAAQRELSTAQRDIEASERDISTSQQNITTAQRDIATAQRDIATAQRDIATAQRDIATAQRDLIDIHRDIRVLTERVNNLVTKRIALNNRFTAFQDRIENLAATYASSDRLAELENNVPNVIHQKLHDLNLINTRDLLEGLSTRIHWLESLNLGNINDRLQGFETRIMALEQDGHRRLDEVNANFQRHGDRLKASEQEQIRINDGLDGLRRENDERRRQVTRLIRQTESVCCIIL